MIIAANGAHKSGSTWLMHLALELRPCVEPPVTYQNPNWETPPIYSIRPELLTQFLADPVVTRQDVLLAHPLVRVLNIKRNLRAQEPLADLAYLQRRMQHPSVRLALLTPVAIPWFSASFRRVPRPRLRARRIAARAHGLQDEG